MPSWIVPTSRAMSTAAWTRSSCGAMLPTALRRAIEMALVGPLMSWREESSSAPTAVITMAV